MSSWRKVLRGLLLILAFSGRAVAQKNDSAAVAPAADSKPTRIVLVAAAGLDELAHRFAAELRSLHFDVVRAAETAEPQAPNALEALALDEHARAAVRVAAAEGALDLWLVNPTTHEAVYRRIVAEKDPAVAVLRSLEILRGSLVDLRALAPPPESPPARRALPLPPVVREPAPASRATWFGVSVAATSRDARSAPAWGALAAFHTAVASKFSLHAEALVPLSEWQVSGEGGRVNAWAGALTVGGSVAPWGERALTPTLGLGVGALALHTRGEATAGFRGTSDLNLVAFPHGRLGASLQISAGLRATGLFLAGFAAPRPVLLFAEERNAAWVNPLLLGALGLEVALN
jgi:hypothetical protein